MTEISEEQKIHLCKSCLCKEQMLGIVITHRVTGLLLFVTQSSKRKSMITHCSQIYQTHCLKWWHKGTAYSGAFDVLYSKGKDQLGIPRSK